MSKTYHVYILTNDNYTALFTGVTGNLSERIFNHKNGGGSAFTRKYKTHKLVYAEAFESADQAIEWEKTIKKWSRRKKDALIQENNPEWCDLASEDLY
jgi:putative endonuclease